MSSRFPVGFLFAIVLALCAGCSSPFRAQVRGEDLLNVEALYIFVGDEPKILEKSGEDLADPSNVDGYVSSAQYKPASGPKPRWVELRADKRAFIEFENESGGKEAIAAIEIDRDILETAKKSAVAIVVRFADPSDPTKKFVPFTFKASDIAELGEQTIHVTKSGATLGP